MEKNYNYNYENRANTKSSANSGVSLGGLQMASCKSSDLKKQPVSNGRLWHTTDTNKFYYDWNGKRQELNVSGDNASLEAEIRKIKADMKNLNPDAVQSKLNQLETKVNNAASQANTAKTAAQTAQQQAAQAAQDAQDAAAQVSGKADKSYVDEAVSHAFDNLTDAQKEELRGPAGTAGKDGKDGVDGQNGQDGAPGKDGVDGKDGADGKDGVDGAPGADGKDGVDGKDGADGKSAFELAVDGGYQGTQSEWLESLKGVDGKDGIDGLPGKDGVDGQNGADGKDGVDGKDGADGKSAYELAVEGGYQGTQAEWLESLKGEGLSQADRDLIDSLAEFGESDITAGTFPSGNNVDDVTAVDGGFATVQDVMDYVNALIEKKKDELAPIGGDDKNYFYVNAVEFTGSETPTPIYQMNCFEINDDDAVTNEGFVFECKAGAEILGYDGGPDDPATTYSQVLTIDVPTGYSIEVHSWDTLNDAYFNAEEVLMSNPKGATKHYAGRTYNSYVRSTNDLYETIVADPLRYKIIIKKTN